MASRKEEKERLRKAREEAEASADSAARKRLVLGYAVAGLISLAVVAGIVFAIAGGGDDSGGGGGTGGDRVNETFGIIPDGISVDDREAADPPTNGDIPDLETAAEDAGCELLLDQEDEGSTHIGAKDPVPDYKADPPTSGDHLVNPLTDGAYLETPSPLNYIHALEHGRIEIQYDSSVTEQEQAELLGLWDEDSAGMILFPNDDSPYAIAATAWQQTLGCDSYEGAATLDAIRAFKAEFRARGPEPIAIQ